MQSKPGRSNSFDHCLPLAFDLDYGINNTIMWLPSTKQVLRLPIHLRSPSNLILCLREKWILETPTNLLGMRLQSRYWLFCCSLVAEWVIWSLIAHLLAVPICWAQVKFHTLLTISDCNHLNTSNRNSTKRYLPYVKEVTIVGRPVVWCVMR